MQFLYQKGYDDSASLKQLMNEATDRLLPLVKEEEQK